jgi:hypothetical protein
MNEQAGREDASRAKRATTISGMEWRRAGQVTPTHKRPVG